MKLTCRQEHLALALNIVGRSVSTRSSLPVLGNVLISGDDDGVVTVAATNLSVRVEARFNGNVDSAGAITLPARLFSEIVNSLPPERVSLAVVQKTQSVALQCGRYDFNVKGIDAADFPSGLDVGVSHVVFDASELKRMISQAGISASTDDSRPTLTGIVISSKEQSLQMVATDGFRLSIASMTADGVEVQTMIVPAKSLFEVERIAGVVKADKIDVSEDAEHNLIVFTLPGEEMVVTFYAQSIDAKFPDYRAIIPASYTTQVIADVATLRKAVKLALLFARDTSLITHLEISPGLDHQMLIRGNSSESGDSLSELDVSAKGEPLKIAVNGKMFSEALDVISAPQVVLEFTHPNRPMTLRQLGAQDEFLYVLMPMQPK